MGTKIFAQLARYTEERLLALIQWHKNKLNEHFLLGWQRHGQITKWIELDRYLIADQTIES
ncbi:hypothetical protein BpHYR1_052588 [Brachionus plicatilis]|uniref:Uncharacterized protein n=1 Tax=Brachionus plicatilis TaxID=10195 RepID=A0A3M7S441_BRAPC|nr:hypothetical protein BpHYR1_052588 [Brachionus plicatilis]